MDPVISPVKRCTLCLQLLPVASFSRKAAAQDGLQPRCKACAHTPRRTKEQRAASRELYAERYMARTGEKPRARGSKGNVRAQKARARQKHYFAFLVKAARRRAEQKGVPFDIDADYLRSIWTGTCPVFGVALERGSRTSPHNAELDRLVPALGYTKGNVAFISRRANRIKLDATPEELALVASWVSSQRLAQELAT